MVCIKILHRILCMTLYGWTTNNVLAVQSKRGAAITTLHIDSELSQHELQQDLGVLAQQALPLELR